MNSPPKVPNFFIAGAAKSGTTALQHYLAGHPNIFMFTGGEVHYFCDDMLAKAKHVHTPEQYLALFAGRTPAQTAVGEKSVWYLYSSNALRRIREFHPGVKVVLMLRNPVDMAASLHAQQLYELNEDEPDFERAWGLQEVRRRGERIPRHAYEPKLLQYHDACALGSQLKRAYRVLSPEQLYVLLFDDFARDPAMAYRQVLRFLGLPDDGRAHFPRINENKRLRLRWVARWTESPHPAVLAAYMHVKRVAGFRGAGVLARLREANTEPAARQSLRPEFRDTLVRDFHDEVDLLEKLLDRDLSSWR